MKGYEITFYFPQPKRRRNWSAVLYYGIIIINTVLWVILLWG